MGRSYFDFFAGDPSAAAIREAVAKGGPGTGSDALDPGRDGRSSSK